MISIEDSFFDEGLVLLHSNVKRNIIIFGPSSTRVEKENGILVTSLDQLVSSGVQEHDMTIMEGVSELEAIDDISVLGLSLLLDLFRSESVLIKSIIVVHFSDHSELGA